MRAVFTGKKNSTIHQYAIGNATVCGKVFRSSLWVVLSDQDTSYGPANCKGCERVQVAQQLEREWRERVLLKRAQLQEKIAQQEAAALKKIKYERSIKGRSLRYLKMALMAPMVLLGLIKALPAFILLALMLAAGAAAVFFAFAVVSPLILTVSEYWWGLLTAAIGSLVCGFLAYGFFKAFCGYCNFFAEEKPAAEATPTWEDYEDEEEYCPSCRRAL